MLFLKYHYQSVVNSDLVLLNPENSVYQLPYPVKLTMSLLVPDNVREEEILLAVLGLECIAGQRGYLNIKKNTVTFGGVSGAKVTLRKRYLYSFLERFAFELLPKTKQFDGVVFGNNSNVFSFTIKDLSIFDELMSIFSLNETHRYLNLQLHFNSSNSGASRSLMRGLSFFIK